MSNDRHNDENVSAAYQELANERTPAHLDKNVLRLAQATAQRPRYARWIKWGRPLAWAATVALCLAITLEITRVPTPDQVLTEALPEAVPETDAAEVAAPAAALAPAPEPEPKNYKREEALDQDANTQLKLADAIASEKVSPARSTTAKAANEPPPAGRLQQSAELAAEAEVEEVTVGYAASRADAADMQANECAEEARSEPKSWWECITKLEAAGAKDAALRERENLEETFPDFKLP